uniref:Uncharacterized protein n=1 Tax=Panagrolaimus sp. PS1159 TaxID=55785 RepID=A0AC35GDR8_9BILA
MERDKARMIKLYDETVEICKRLYEDWSKLPSFLTEGCVEISDDEMEESGVFVELSSDEAAVTENTTSPHASSSPKMMDADFDTPEHISQPVDDIDIGAKKHFGSSSPDDEHRSEKENSHGKKFRSRSRSRSYSSKRKQRSRLRSSIGYAKFLNNAIK